MSIGYIWSVREGWGKEAFDKIRSHYNYGYNIARRPKTGDVLVFYSKKKLIGSIPVDSDSRKVTYEDSKKDPDVRNWKYLVGLDGSRKVVFPSPVEVKNVAGDISILKGKKNLHNTCRFSPKITMEEYNLIKEKSKKH